MAPIRKTVRGASVVKDQKNRSGQESSYETFLSMYGQGTWGYILGKIEFYPFFYRLCLTPYRDIPALSKRNPKAYADWGHLITVIGFRHPNMDENLLYAAWREVRRAYHKDGSHYSGEIKFLTEFYSLSKEARLKFGKHAQVGMVARESCTSGAADHDDRARSEFYAHKATASLRRPQQLQHQSRATSIAIAQRGRRNESPDSPSSPPDLSLERDGSAHPTGNDGFPEISARSTAHHGKAEKAAVPEFKTPRLPLRLRMRNEARQARVPEREMPSTTATSSNNPASSAGSGVILPHCTSSQLGPESINNSSTPPQLIAPELSPSSYNAQDRIQSQSFAAPSTSTFSVPSQQSMPVLSAEFSATEPQSYLGRFEQFPIAPIPLRPNPSVPIYQPVIQYHFPIIQPFQYPAEFIQSCYRLAFDTINRHLFGAPNPSTDPTTANIPSSLSRY
ncbi:hypothetical protein QR680_019330 [Steinernema hermaphroditum]|uniref:Uncharacterized protein n=1 Tax=Steinernema hermaphroditum TaxID=289476 RepID=A0AA39LAR7_9BILA|nr:hypothetical protein QR680_019330 [Steinernema hermaphroditum]